MVCQSFLYQCQFIFFYFVVLKIFGYNFLFFEFILYVVIGYFVQKRVRGVMILYVYGGIIGYFFKVSQYFIQLVGFGLVNGIRFRKKFKELLFFCFLCGGICQICFLDLVCFFLSYINNFFLDILFVLFLEILYFCGLSYFDCFSLCYYQDNYLSFF